MQAWPGARAARAGGAAAAAAPDTGSSADRSQSLNPGGAGRTFRGQRRRVAPAPALSSSALGFPGPLPSYTPAPLGFISPFSCTPLCFSLLRGLAGVLGKASWGWEQIAQGYPRREGGQAL